MCCQEGARLDGDGDIFEMAEDESLTANFLYLGFATLAFWKSLFKASHTCLGDVEFGNMWERNVCWQKLCTKTAFTNVVRD